jgi:membrane associated rhomboid family serine protease
LGLAESRAVAADAADEAERFVERQARRVPLVTWGIVAVCCAVFGLQWLWGRGEVLPVAGRMGAEIPAAVARGEGWRLLAATLLHASFAHLGWNAVALLLFGPFLERLLGGARFLVVFVGSAACGSLLSLTRVTGLLGLGASGGVWGVLVAAAVVVTVPRALVPEPLALRYRRHAWMPVAVGLIYTVGDLRNPGIDVVAHLGGGLAGGVLAVLLTRSAAHHRLPAPSLPVRLAAGALGALLVGSMAVALARGRPWAPEQPWRVERVAIGGSGWSIEVPAGFSLAADPVLRRWTWGDLNADGARIVVYLPGPPPPWTDPEDPLLRAVSIGLEERVDAFAYAVGPRPERLPSGREAVFAELRPRRHPWSVVWIWRSGPDDDPVTVIAHVLRLTSAPRRDQIRRIAGSLEGLTPEDRRGDPG